MSNTRPTTQISKNQTCKIVLDCPIGTIIELVDEREAVLEGIECRIRSQGRQTLIRITDNKGQIDVQPEDVGNASEFEVDFPTLENEHISVGKKDQPATQGAGFRCSPNRHYQFRYNTRTKVYMGLFFDGTGNNMYVDEAERRMSNVACLYRAFDQRKDLNQIARYVNGVGTQLNSTECGLITPFDCLAALRDSEIVGGGFAAGIRNRLNFMLGKIDDVFIDFPDIQHLDIALFGFSRGAITARIFCNWINEHTPQWQEKFSGLEVNIRFLGIFDSVSSIGIAGNNVDIGYNKDIPSNVKTVVHMIATHERRKLFPLQSIRTSSSGTLPANWIELGYPGVHSDIGGGYVLDQHHPDSQGRYPRLAAIPLRNMHDFAIGYGVPLTPITDFAHGQRKLFDYYDPSDQAKNLYDQYQSLVPTQWDICKLYDEHDRWYFYWLASTKNKTPINFDTSSIYSLKVLWNREYNIFKNGYFYARNSSGKIVRTKTHISQSAKLRISWIEEYLDEERSGTITTKSNLNTFFETYVHDSVAAYRIVDDYFQSRKIYYLRESRWVEES